MPWDYDMTIYDGTYEDEYPEATPLPFWGQVAVFLGTVAVTSLWIWGLVKLGTWIAR